MPAGMLRNRFVRSIRQRIVILSVGRISFFRKAEPTARSFLAALLRMTSKDRSLVASLARDDRACLSSRAKLTRSRSIPGGEGSRPCCQSEGGFVPDREGSLAKALRIKSRSLVASLARDDKGKHCPSSSGMLLPLRSGCFATAIAPLGTTGRGETDH